VPLAVKIAPDLDDAELPRIADALVAHEIDAVIATNTTIARDSVAGLPHAEETGGLSGAPLARALHRGRAHARAAPEGRAAGDRRRGIMSGGDAVAKIAAGAALVQLYTGIIYRGPTLVGECRRAILRQRRRSN